MAKSKDFYPCIMHTDPPYLMTREMMEDYFKKRGTAVKVLHIPATNPQEERNGQ